jgi:hypothetical protein
MAIGTTKEGGFAGINPALLLCFFVVQLNQAGRLAANRGSRRDGSFIVSNLPPAWHLGTNYGAQKGTVLWKMAAEFTLPCS